MKTSFSILFFAITCITSLAHAQTKRIYNAMLSNPSEHFIWSSMDNAGAIMEFEDYPQFKISVDSSQFKVQSDSTAGFPSDSTKNVQADTVGLGLNENKDSRSLVEMADLYTSKEVALCTEKKSYITTPRLNKTIEPIPVSTVKIANQETKSSKFGFSGKHWIRWLIGGFIFFLVVRIKPGFG